VTASTVIVMTNLKNSTFSIENFCLFFKLLWENPNPFSYKNSLLHTKKARENLYYITSSLFIYYLPYLFLVISKLKSLLKY
ncbi:hypothetical protein ACRCJZ_09605, partial [Aerococcus urinaeequi]|uniref:hypothetical protein n=1 Tax=Aerococcus urinaeequi TaxID=51665 RepID=UPI003D6C2E6C